MSTNSKKVARKLKNLMQKMFYAERGLHKVANYAKHKDIRDYFIEKAKERREFAIELKNEIESIGESSGGMGSLIGSAHMVWIHINALVSLNVEASMLKLTEREERATLTKYMNTITEINLAISSKNLLIKQKNQLEKDLNEIRELKANN